LEEILIIWRKWIKPVDAKFRGLGREDEVEVRVQVIREELKYTQAMEAFTKMFHCYVIIRMFL